MALHREQHQLEVLTEPRRRDRAHRRRRGRAVSLDREPGGVDRLDVGRGAVHQQHVVAGAGERRAGDAADRARAVDRDGHRVPGVPHATRAVNGGRSPAAAAMRARLVRPLAPREFTRRRLPTLSHARRGRPQSPRSRPTTHLSSRFWTRCYSQTSPERDHRRSANLMRLTAFRVQMFKCVIDSDWIAVTPLTMLVGKNESGKTALLKALHKFNPFKPEPYATREWPRGHRDTQSTEQVVCVAEFELSHAEVAELRALTNMPALPGTLQVTKDYAGKFEVLFPTEVFPDKLHPNEVDRLCGSLPEPPQPIGAPFTTQAHSCKEEAVRLAHEGRFSELASIPETHRVLLQGAMSPADHQPQHRTRKRLHSELHHGGGRSRADSSRVPDNSATGS